MIWNRTYECMTREEMRELQGKRLARTVAHVYKNVEFYREQMQRIGMTPHDVQSVDDLHKLPFTNKTDLRDNYPFGLFAVPQSEIVRIHASSGTTGKPTVVGYTARDIDSWAEIMARALMCGGTSKKSIVQVAYGYGLFTGGLGAHYGAERLGASVIPMSGGNTKRQIMLMEDFGSTTLCCTPSYALMLGEAIHEAGIPLSRLKLRNGVFGAEPWTEGMRTRIEELLGINAYDIYGLSEIIGPGVGMECECKAGMHIWEDHFLPEIIDPVTGEVLPFGQRGELVFTTITKEGFPMIRYRTHDITSLIQERCECGRTHVRMHKITGRTDDMLIIRGVNVFPSQIETVLVGIPGLSPHYLLVVERHNNLDTLEVRVEVTEEVFSDEVRKLEDLSARISREIESSLGLSVKLRLVEPHSIERSEGKATRVIDNRRME